MLHAENHELFIIIVACTTDFSHPQGLKSYCRSVRKSWGGVHLRACDVRLLWPWAGLGVRES